MNEVSFTSVQVERRLHVRYPTRTQVYVKAKGHDRVSCQAVNLSINGVAIRTENLGLLVGTSCELTFVIILGTLTKLHRRIAVVKHVTNGVTGFEMEPYKEH